MYNDFKLLERIIKLDEWFMYKMNHWPSKSMTYEGLGTRINRCFRLIEEKLSEHHDNARLRSKQYRGNLLYEASTELDYLKILIPRLRMLKIDVQKKDKDGNQIKSTNYYISKKNHEYLVRELHEIGCMLGSYIKSYTEGDQK